MIYILAGLICTIVGFVMGFLCAMYLCWRQESISTDKRLRRLLEK